MSEQTSQMVLGQIIDALPIVQTLAGKFADVHRVFGDVNFDCFPPMYSHVEESALKVIRVCPTNRGQMNDANNMLTLFSERLSANEEAYSHPNIAPCNVATLRMTTTRGPVTFKALLTPWYSGGNILEYVQTFTGVNRITLLIEIGKALRHLHAHNMVHGAIYPLNILVSSDGRVVVTDAGIRTLLSQFIFLPSGHLPIPPSARYQSSAQLRPATDTFVIPTASMDVYSFATTAWAVFAGVEPFSDVPRFRRYEQVIAEIRYRGHQFLDKPNDMSAELWELLRRCLDSDPALRPSMHVVVAGLEGLNGQ